MRRILHLGAGNRPIAAAEGEEVVNHDRTKHRPEIVVAWDLNDLPWPWPDASFDLIIACTVLEHLRITLVESLNECWRILRPGGRLHVKVPHWQHENSYTDPTHYWRFSLQTFDLFDPATRYGADYGFYTERKWRTIKPAHLNPSKSSIIAVLEVRK